jgi:muconolactone D-isomerase
MEYLIDFTIDVPDGTSSNDVDRRARAEAERVDELGREGHVLRVWRPMPDDGRGRAIGLYRADDEAELKGILETLPLYPWMTISVRALAPHPNDPERLSDASPARVRQTTNQ